VQIFDIFLFAPAELAPAAGRFNRFLLRQSSEQKEKYQRFACEGGVLASVSIFF